MPVPLNDVTVVGRKSVALEDAFWGWVDTRLDTPPSLNRRHPNSSLAPRLALPTSRARARP